jgi:hypothetical protein
MALGTYGQLKTSVASWLHRTDLTSEIADFVALAEAQIRRDVRCRAMEASATGTLSAVTLALPTRFAQARRVLLGDVTQRYVTPEEFQPLRNSSNARYTILGTNFVFQASTSDYQIDYYQWFEAFADDADTNWLLTNYPDIYLSASMVEAVSFINGDPSLWAARYQAGLNKLKVAEADMTGPLVVRVDATEW